MFYAALVPVRSSNLAAVGYNPTAAMLAIAFHGGRAYRDFAVPVGVYVGLMAAGSQGKYFHAVIRNRFFSHRIQ